MGRHRPLRRKVVWDGSAYVGTCRHCDRPIRRKSRRQWRADPDSVPVR
ncbi:MAG: hypothetical protein RIB52_09595 [Erythrobacter sp.]